MIKTHLQFHRLCDGRYSHHRPPILDSTLLYIDDDDLLFTGQARPHKHLFR